MGACCSADQGIDAPGAAGISLRDEIANPANDKAPSFKWRFRDSHDEAKLKQAGAIQIAKGLAARAQAGAGPIALELQKLHLGDKGACELAHGLQTKGLVVSCLNLTSNGLTAIGAAALADAISPQLKLQKLIVGRNDIEPDGITALARLSCPGSTITTLELPLGTKHHSAGPIGASDDVIDALCDASRKSSLVSLTLRFWGDSCTGDAVAVLLASSVDSATLREFRGIGTPEMAVKLSAQLGPAAKALRDLPCKLTVLELRHVTLDSAAFSALFANLSDSRCTLKELVVAGCGMNDDAAAHLAASLPRNRSIRTLEFSASTELGPAGLTRLFQCLAGNKTLKTLTFTQMPFSVDCARVLVETLELPTAAPITVARHSMIDNDRLATRLADVLHRNECRVEDETASTSDFDEPEMNSQNQFSPVEGAADEEDDSQVGFPPRQQQPSNVPARRAVVPADDHDDDDEGNSQTGLSPRGPSGAVPASQAAAQPPADDEDDEGDSQMGLSNRREAPADKVLAIDNDSDSVASSAAPADASFELVV